MQLPKELSQKGVQVLLVVIVFLLLSVASSADTERVIYSFTGALQDEGAPYSGLIFDKAGSLYGTTCGNDSPGSYGTAFKLTPTHGGRWKLTPLYIFTGATDGNCPHAALVRDSIGNLYGTTTAGGNLNYCNGFGCGTVFRLSPTSKGKWKETVLHSFTNGGDGGYPSADLTLDAKGSLYGTTLKGGSAGGCGGLGCGVAFKLTLTSKGKWKESVLHTFTNGADGGAPYSDLVFDAAGNLYGTASDGGTGGYGTVFKLSRGSNGWQETTLYSFQYRLDGGIPRAGLIMDLQGNLYGTTSSAGGGAGVVFELTPTSNGWAENVLYSFTGNNDGQYPHAGVIFDAAGNLYGTNFYGGTFEGTVFELTPGSQGWSETVLYRFTGGKDGGLPEAGVILDKAGNLYGTASVGGASGWGCVFQLAPTSNAKSYQGH